MAIFESWNAGGNHSYFYTEDWLIARELIRDFPFPTVYERGNNTFAWQFLLPNRMCPLLRKKFGIQGNRQKDQTKTLKNPVIDNQGVTET